MLSRADARKCQSQGLLPSFLEPRALNKAPFDEAPCQVVCVWGSVSVPDSNDFEIEHGNEKAR
jgi:hypothetical protein